MTTRKDIDSLLNQIETIQNTVFVEKVPGDDFQNMLMNFQNSLKVAIATQQDAYDRMSDKKQNGAAGAAAADAFDNLEEALKMFEPMENIEHDKVSDTLNEVAYFVLLASS